MNLEEGTLLGAVKFGTLLPWERDADFRISFNDFNRFREEIIPDIKTDGIDLLKVFDNRVLVQYDFNRSASS